MHTRNARAVRQPATPPQRRPYIGVGVIVLRAGRVLLGKRRHAHGAGCWQFPGGHLEYGESIDACARRELFEETGLSIVNAYKGPFTNDIFAADGKHYVTLFIIADQTVGSVVRKEPHKCEGWDWFSWSSLPEPHFLPIVHLLEQGFAIDAKPSPAATIMAEMAEMGSPERADGQRRFFKTGPGEYGAGDLFFGIRVPQLRKLARIHTDAPMAVIEDLLHAPIHEQRQLALFLLAARFDRAAPSEQAAIADFYLANTAWVNNWDLVDCSAHSILGAYLLDRDRTLLYRLAENGGLWERRIAIVATWRFIRAGQPEETFQLATRLLDDREDLIHKAVGWMLREAGKRDPDGLAGFLAAYCTKMPRTMLRYAIERLPASQRQTYLRKSE
jgi:3-methyladenine DNA glycosylase AlkD/ADP-ribose pyrophosphatase YjhB (NUDIX family)